MSQVLALLTAFFYGIADFSGGLASRSLVPWRVAAWSQVFALPLLALGLVIVGASAVSTADIAYGAVGGLFGLIGVGLLYSALAEGTMSIVSPITGALAAALPVAWGLATGEVITALQWFGIALALIAVVMIAAGPSHARATPRVLVQSILAAVGFATFFIALGQTSAEAGLWPLVGARAVSIPAAFVVAALVGSAAPPPRNMLPIVTGAGSADMAANITIVLALQTGPIGINSVLASLYPAFTVLAAVLFLRERPNAVQRVGIVCALVAAVALAV